MAEPKEVAKHRDQQPARALAGWATTVLCAGLPLLGVPLASAVMPVAATPAVNEGTAQGGKASLREAVAAAEAAAAQHPDDPAVLAGAAAAWTAAGAYEKAVAALEAACKHRPQDPDPPKQLAIAWAAWYAADPPRPGQASGWEAAVAERQAATAHPPTAAFAVAMAAALRQDSTRLAQARQTLATRDPHGRLAAALQPWSLAAQPSVDQARLLAAATASPTRTANTGNAGNAGNTGNTGNTASTASTASTAKPANAGRRSPLQPTTATWLWVSGAALLFIGGATWLTRKHK